MAEIITDYADLTDDKKRTIITFAVSGTTPGTIASATKVSEAVVREVLMSYATSPEMSEEQVNTALDLERLGRLSTKMWQRASAGDDGAAFTAMDIMDKRSALFRSIREEEENRSPAKTVDLLMADLMRGVEIDLDEPLYDEEPTDE